MKNQNQSKVKKVVLAFSGGLDTSFCVVYLKEKFNCEVVTVTVDTGGFDKKEIEEIAKKSKELGAAKHYFLDGKKEVFNSVQYIIKGNILRGGNYPMSAGLERLAIAKLVSQVAKKEKADAVAHGSTSVGNDQIRFDLAFQSLLPGVKILVPFRDLNMKRMDEEKFLKNHGFKVSAKTAKYSVNKGFWGNTVSGGEIHNSWQEIPVTAFPHSFDVGKSPNKPGYVAIGFKKGIPVSVNDKKFNPLEIITTLNKIGYKHGVGKETVLTTLALGLKARIGVEAPAALILIKAHQHLEGLTLTWEQILIKDLISQFYREYIHKGLSFDPVVKDIEALIDNSQKFVTGQVKIKLFKGHISAVACQSPYSLMLKDFGVYTEKASWSGEEARGFVKLSGLQGTIANIVHNKLTKKN